MRIASILGCLLLSATATFADTLRLVPSTSRPGQPVIASIGNQSLANPAHIDGISDGGNNTVIIDASPGTCNAVCGQEEEVWIRAPGRAGTYSVQYWVTAAGQRTLAAQAQLVVAGLCDFGHSLATVSAGVSGGFGGLTWCDPSYSMDGWNYSARLFRIYSAQSADGPFAPVFDVANATSVYLKPPSSGTTYYYVQSHGCLGLFGGCNQPANFDMPYTTNIIAVTAPPSTGCVPGDITLCALHDRFSITAQWTTADGHHGVGLAVPITDGSGYFYFFNHNSVEVTVKMLDACSLQSPAFWVFISGMTNVQVDLTVTDTVTHTTKTYSNPQGAPFASVLDTNAFSCR
jgi:hypothetical protein